MRCDLRPVLGSIFLDQSNDEIVSFLAPYTASRRLYIKLSEHPETESREADTGRVKIP